MARAKYQILVIPYCMDGSEIQYCIFRRSDMKIWQFIAGGGEAEDSSVTASAKREAYEEAGIPMGSDYVRLDTCCSIPTDCFKNAEAVWGRDCFVIPEYAFAVKLKDTSLALSREHTEYKWMDYESARAVLEYDSNKTALWELNRRIKQGMLS